MYRKLWQPVLLLLMAVSIPYMSMAEAAHFINVENTGLSEAVFHRIEGQIESDIAKGFPSAQLVVRKNGKLVYRNAWGRVNSYGQDGMRLTNMPPVTDETLYDLASNTKMYSVNYALQYLVTHEGLDLDTKITDILGQEFAADVKFIAYEKGTTVPLLTQRRWKASLTLRDLLMHQGGFPPGPAYYRDIYDQTTQEWQTDVPNVLYAGAASDEGTRKRTWQRICETPLMYEPGTKTMYSDVDYVVLGLVVEKLTGKSLQAYLKETFWQPLGLTHITYLPLKNGFTQADCAATELNGNTRDGVSHFPGIREYTLQGEVHDEMARYSMGGISGHAGLFANAEDLAKLAELMLTGKHDGKVYFSPEVMGEFTADHGTGYGLGWWVQGDHEWDSYFGAFAPATTFGHQGWTGTLTVIDPENAMVIVLLTNKINTPIDAPQKDANNFIGGHYTTGKLGFVTKWIYEDMRRN